MVFQHTATRRWLIRFWQSWLPEIWFQHTATRRWLKQLFLPFCLPFDVSTHSHPKVAEPFACFLLHISAVSTHSHPKVAEQSRVERVLNRFVSTHSHPKVAERARACQSFFGTFQHTATRRWLRIWYTDGSFTWFVSTHSHPKVAEHLFAMLLSV